MNNDEAITIENCPHVRFNSGYQRRCESGCGHTMAYIQGWNARAAEVEALSQIARDIQRKAKSLAELTFVKNYCVKCGDDLDQP